MVMKNLFLVVLFAVSSTVMRAQVYGGMSASTMVFGKFSPAEILMEDGRVIKTPSANVFMKNGSLVYKHGLTTMQASMRLVKQVRIADRLYLRTDTALAYVVDSVGKGVILCKTLIDADGYQRNMANSVDLTSLSLGGDQVSMTTLERYTDSDERYPLVNYYYLKYGSKLVLFEERALKRALSRDREREMLTLMQLPDFSWDNVKYMKKILELLQK